jgi:hypothetical protein
MPSRTVSSPLHPVDCRGPTCAAKVWMKNIRPPRDGPRLLRLPLDAEPSDAGTIAARAHSGEPGRFLARGEELAPGESRWVSHFDTCPDAATFRHTAQPEPPSLF